MGGDGWCCFVHPREGRGGRMILGGGNEVGGWGVWILLGERNRGEG